VDFFQNSKRRRIAAIIKENKKILSILFIPVKNTDPVIPHLIFFQKKF